MDYFCAETEASRTTWEENWKERKKKWRSYPNIFLAFLKTWASFPNDWFQNVWKQRPTKGKKWRGLWQQSKEEWGRVWEKARPEKPYTIAWWTPRFVESTVEGSRRPAVDTNALFDDFLHLGWWRRRFVRATYGAVFFFGISWVIMQLLHDAPTRLLIRGNLSHWVDAIVLMLEVGSFLLALFYTLDGACLTGRFLDCISRHPTAWPEWLLQQKGKERGIDGTYLDGWLDVDFAAVQTKETGPLMFGPLLILLVLIISRLSYFDSWTWPTGLVIILVTSFALAAASWRLVRRAAKAVRQHALKRLDAVILTVESSGDYDQAPNSAEIRRGRIRKQVCIDRLKALRQDVDEEDRGAYAPWFQDPTYIALFVPTGVTGILSIAIQFWLNR
jgi:hypothetical protein